MSVHTVKETVHPETLADRAFSYIIGLGVDGSGNCKFKMSNTLILKLHKMCWDQFYNLKNLPFALNSPVAIFRGIGREGHEHSYCYVSKPTRYWHGEGDNDWSQRRIGFLFTVYIMDTYEIYSWKFEKSDGDSDDLPENHQNRYGELLWPKR
jgi:hypothetical protein